MLPAVTEDNDLLMVNETQTPFVLPTRGLYEYKLREELCINVPLNPQCAIMFEECDENEISQRFQSRIVVMQKGYDDVVMKMNGYAMERQCQEKLGYVVCKDRDILSQLSKKYHAER